MKCGFILLNLKKSQSKHWKRTDSPPPKKLNRFSSAGKVIWDSHGILLAHFIPKGQTATARHYLEVVLKQEGHDGPVTLT